MLLPFTLMLPARMLLFAHIPCAMRPLCSVRNVQLKGFAIGKVFKVTLVQGGPLARRRRRRRRCGAIIPPIEM